MHALVLFLALLFAPPAQEVKTVRECLLDGDSHVITDPYNTDILDISGMSAWEAEDQDALKYGTHPGGTFAIDTDTGPRSMYFVAYQGRLYLFIYQHSDRAYKVSPGVWNLHGRCMLRLR